MEKNWKRTLISGVALVLILVLVSLNWKVSYMNYDQISSYYKLYVNLFGGYEFMGKGINFWVSIVHHVVCYFFIGLFAIIALDDKKGSLIKKSMMASVIVYFLAVSDELVKTMGVAFDLETKSFGLKLISGIVGIVVYLIPVTVMRRRKTTN